MLSSKLSAAQPGANRTCAHICCFWLEWRGRPRANSLCGWLQHLASEARLIGKHRDPTLTHHSGPSLLCFVLFFCFVFQKGVTDQKKSDSIRKTRETGENAFTCVLFCFLSTGNCRFLSKGQSKACPVCSVLFGIREPVQRWPQTRNRIPVFV